MKPVSMYTLSTCPWCRKTKAFFREAGIAFDFIDYDLADEPTRARIIGDMDAHGATGFPCCDAGRFFAVARRCGHMSAPLEQGTLVGTVLTCPMHCAQFDVTTGEALAGPMPHDWGTERPPPKIGQHLTHISALMADIATESLRTYETQVESGFVWVAVDG